MHFEGMTAVASKPVVPTGTSMQYLLYGLWVPWVMTHMGSHVACFYARGA